MIRAEVKGADGVVKQEVIRRRDNVDGVYDEELIVDPSEPDSAGKLYAIRSVGPVVLDALEGEE